MNELFNECWNVSRHNGPYTFDFVYLGGSNFVGITALYKKVALWEDLIELNDDDHVANVLQKVLVIKLAQFGEVVEA